MKEGFKEALEKAIAAKDSFNDYCTLTINNDWGIDVYVSPSADMVHQAVAAFTGLIGKLEKKQELWGTDFEFTGANDFINVKIKTPESCKIVGYKIEKRPKKVWIESSEIETVKTPVTDCDFRTGKVTAGEFEFIKESDNV